MYYNKSLFFIICITLVLAFAFQGSRGLWEPDEGRYVRCAYEMLQSGDWLTPRLNGNPHFSKPPLTYWLIATGISLFGTNEWGARFFHALAFVFTTLLVGALGTRMWDQKTGLLGCLVFGTMIIPYTAANTATTDTILTFFETAAIVCFWFSLTTRQSYPGKSIVWNFSLWFFLGLAFLTKGPPGLIPLAVIILYVWLTKNRTLFSPLTITAGIVIFSAVSLPWYFLVIQKYSGLFGYFINDEVIGRIITGEHSRNSGLFGALKVYPHTLLLGALPWSYFWFFTVPKTRPHIFSSCWWRSLRERKNALFIVLWFCVPLVIFSISSSRLPLYVLPLFAPLALATARSLFLYYPKRAFSICGLKGKAGVYVVILICFLLSTRVITTYFPTEIDSRAVWNNISRVIQKRVGNAPYELVLFDLDHEGLAFYSGKMVDTVTFDNKKSLSYAGEKPISKKCDELTESSVDHIFLVHKRKLSKLKSVFDKRQLRCAVEDGPFDYKLIFCERTDTKNISAKLAESFQLNPGINGTIKSPPL